MTMDKTIFEEPYQVHLWQQGREHMRRHAVATGREFTLRSGRESDFYVDCRVAALMHPDGSAYHPSRTSFASLIELALIRVMLREEVVRLAPVPLGGIFMLLRIPVGTVVIPRSEEKDHGMKRKVEGLLDASGRRLVEEGAKVLLVEDVITTGGSTLEAAQTLQEAALDPVGVLVLVDREEGGRQALEDAGLQVWSVFTQSDLR